MTNYKPEDLVSRLKPLSRKSREDMAYLFSEPSRAAATLNILNDANLLDAALTGSLDGLPSYASEGLVSEDLARIARISFDPDEFEFLVDFYAELYPELEYPLSQATQELYDDEVEEAAAGIQDEILGDREASYVVMERALRLSRQFDKDQQVVANDIIASFTYSHGMSPEDYADSVRNPHEM